MFHVEQYCRVVKNASCAILSNAKGINDHQIQQSRTCDLKIIKNLTVRAHDAKKLTARSEIADLRG